MSGAGAAGETPRVTIVNIDSPDHQHSVGAPATPANHAPSVADSAGTTKDSVGSLKGLSKKLSNSLSFLKRGASESRADKLRKDVDFTEHTWPIDKLYEYYGSSPTEGLSGAQVLQNRNKYGWNRLTPPPTTPWYIKYLMQYANIFMLLLMAGGVLCFVAYSIDSEDATNLYLGVVLFLVVIVSATFGYLTEAKAENVMEGFKKLVPKKCRVLRDGHLVVLDAEELVPGDVVEIQDGDQVPADMRVVSAIDLKVDNSSLTGESEAQERYPELDKDAQGNLIVTPLESSNLMFYTTIATSGSGRAVVIATGDKTVMGQIAGLAMETGSNDKTQFQIEVDIFIKIISVIAIVIGVAFILIGTLAANAPAIDMVVFAIGIIVGTVPEGLLITLIVSLSLSAKHMYSKNVLVKGMPSVENLGSTTVIASDKTGTLTQNRMTVQHAWYNRELVQVPAARNRQHWRTVMKAATQHGPVYNPEDPTWVQLQKVATLCNNSRFILKDPNDDEKPAINLAKALEDPDFNMLDLNCTGDASESGLIKCVEMLRDVTDYHEANPKLHEIKFNSTNKWQLSIHRPEDAGPKTAPLMVLKGAPERVIRMCTKIMINGKEEPLTRELFDQFNQAYEALGAMGERVLGFAYKNMEGTPMDYAFTNKPEPNFDVKELVFVGLLSLIDPPREGVPEAVAKCKRGGIKVFMVTGDHPITAQAIARKVGIIDQEKLEKGKAAVIKGDDIREWQDIEDPVARQAKWDWALSHEQVVFARVSPAHKLLIVENCQRRGENVAVTGDGVNDAPALKKANTGIAMGISGKDVSKEAADMILIDDNFASIVNGIEEGRVIFDNLKKSITYTLASKLPQQIPFLLYVIARFPLAISTILILTIDIGCDMVPAISLAYEKSEADIMSRPPRNPATQRLVNRRLISHSYFQIGVMQAMSGFLAFMAVMNDYGYHWSTLPGIGLNWMEDPMLCRVNWSSTGIPTSRDCGYGCDEPEKTWNGQQTLYGAYEAKGIGFCQDGCPIPFNGTSDPFVESTQWGFRGRVDQGPLAGNYESGPLAGKSKADTAVCGRSCAWYASLTDDDKAFFVATHEGFLARLRAGVINPSNPFDYSPDAKFALILSQEEISQFEVYCGTSNKTHTLGAADTQYGFPGRGLAYSDNVAVVGSYYWWNARPQYWGNQAYQDNVLRLAQTAYFWGVLVSRWADLLICKTRKETIMNQGFSNRVLNFALLFETTVALLITYVPPLNTVWSTRPLNVVYLFVGVPYFIFIFAYDELRKLAIRRKPGGWVDQNAYW
ncbi:hypothetical protein N2152v2_006517 [Parachlorella kessleri]